MATERTPPPRSASPPDSSSASRIAASSRTAPERPLPAIGATWRGGSFAPSAVMRWRKRRLVLPRGLVTSRRQTGPHGSLRREGPPPPAAGAPGASARGAAAEEGRVVAERGGRAVAAPVDQEGVAAARQLEVALVGMLVVGERRAGL